LQKEVWEDEGVIVGRSLDMFISRLRKKFEKDPLVKIVNIHGKGYRLDIGQG
jgi:DNA-binding response OmpR family regulator